MAIYERIRSRIFGERPDLALLNQAFADHAASHERLQATSQRLSVALHADNERAREELEEVRAATARMIAN